MLELDWRRAGSRPVMLLGHLNLVRALGLGGFRAIVAGPDPHDPVARSRYVCGTLRAPGFSGAHAARTLEALLAAGRTLSRRLGRPVPLIYGSDAGLAFLHRHRAALATDYLTLLNDDRLAARLADKDAFAELCRERGVLSPRSLPADHPGVLDMRFPVLVKPRQKLDMEALRRDLLGDAKARIFTKREALADHPGVRAHAAELVVQEYVPGGDDAIYSFHGFADHGSRVLAWYVGRKLRTFPELTGESSYIQLCRRPELAALGQDIIERLGVVGIFKLDLKQGADDGRYHALELNARFNLWHYLGAASGVNLPAIACHYLSSGRLPAAARYGTRRRWLDFYMDYQAYRERRARGTLSLPSWLAALMSPRTLYSSFAWRDPAPWLVWLGRVVKARTLR